jgi:hypothetical protein
LTYYDYKPDSTSGTVMGHRLNNDEIGVQFLAGARDLSSPQNSDQL